MMELSSWAPFAPGRLTRYLHKLRTEGQGRGRQAAAVGLGIFIGCTPFYGLHFWICLAAGWLLRLNRLKLYLAANISNPICAPFIVFSEIQIGSLIRQGTPYPVSVATLQRLDPWLFSADLLLGSVVVGGLLGVLGGCATWAMFNPLPPAEDGLVSDAAASYLNCGIPAWEFANGKLRMDPVYLDVTRLVPLPDEGRILDLGCGRGLMLALLGSYYARKGKQPGAGPLLHGVEYRARMVRLARRALGESATIEQRDLGAYEIPPCRTALLLDVLHCLPEAVQDRLLERLRESIEPGGVLVIREANAAGGWRFRVGEWTNRLVAVLQGRWQRRFHFRTADQWIAVLDRFGFAAETGPRIQSTPYANVLLWARRRAA